MPVYCVEFISPCRSHRILFQCVIQSPCISSLPNCVHPSSKSLQNLENRVDFQTFDAALAQRASAFIRRFFSWPLCSVPTLALLDPVSLHGALLPFHALGPMLRRLAPCPPAHHGARALLAALVVVPVVQHGGQRARLAPGTRRGYAVNLRAVGEDAREDTRLAKDLVQNGFALVEMDAGMQELLRKYMECAERYMVECEKVHKVRWEDTYENGGKFVGVQVKSGRRFWQMREPRGAWPPQDLVERARIAGCAELAVLAGKAQGAMEEVARRCLQAILRASDLDGLVVEEENSTKPYGPSVLRVFRYDPTANPICGLHADIGLLSFSPKPSLPGLEILDGRSGITIPVDAMQKSNELLVFVGETLSKLTHGFFRPTLHQVRPHKVEAHRLSLVFFQRGEVNAKFPSNGPLSKSTTVAQYTEEELLKKRWWRASGQTNGEAGILDY